MGFRYEKRGALDAEKSFRAIELYGTLQIERVGFIPFKQVLLLDSENETLCFVEMNINQMINLAVKVKKMDYV